jgi:F-type H+-transporting ATPase subunit b
MNSCDSRSRASRSRSRFWPFSCSRCRRWPRPPHGEKKGGLDFTGIKRWDLGIYTLVVFGLLMFILTKYAWPHIKAGLEKREVNIRGALDEAKTVLADAKREREAAQAKLAETALEVKAILDEARRDAEALRTDEREKGVKEAQAAKQAAERQIANDRDALLKDVYEQAVKLAALMSEKALQRAVSEADHRRLLDESIAELNRAANKA